ncbi:peptidylprolyl isomerase [Streptomyces sp. NPDC001933]|uniref:peptidylprolyl isomerase n=1 Tax=Streptomyces sp. NPDC001933 TaxID=3364626 RepID=UPI003694CF2D
MSKVRLATNHGDIILQLDAEKAPKKVENFVQYVEDGFHDGTVGVVHRDLNPGNVLMAEDGPLGHRTGHGPAGDTLRLPPCSFLLGRVPTTS